MNRDNQPTYNTNRNVTNFGDFCANIDSEKEELKKMKRQTIPNTPGRHQIPGNRRLKFNKVTRKMDDISPYEINDKIDSIEDIKEAQQNQMEKEWGEIWVKFKKESGRYVHPIQPDCVLHFFNWLRENYNAPTEIN
jgi:hypothetical protein